MITQNNRTLLFGEGLFETIHWRGVTKKLILHYERLKTSADFLSMPCPSFDEFLNHLMESTKDNLDKNVKYCLFSKGDGVYYNKPCDYEYQIIIRDMPQKPTSVLLTYSPFKKHSKDPVIYHKTMNYTFNILVKREAIKRGFYDAIVLNECDMITECSSSNIIVLKDSRLFTPSRDSGLLFGTCLQVFLNHQLVNVKGLHPRDLEESDGVFLVNSIMGVLPVSRLNENLLPVEDNVCHYLNKILIEENTPIG
ncbi:MAG: aminotransferase class IV [Thermodesulfovibrionales bacterium]|nr:aminotransferase class IV [Thermodesulfovibrionales bacterium]